MNERQARYIFIIQITNGLISFAASCTVVFMIHRSNMKLSTIYRRLFYGICIFDIIQSLSQASSSLSMPSSGGSTPTMFGAVGNDVTCTIQGFMVVIGLNGAIWYSFSITIYFLAVLKFNCTERTVKKFIEPFLHALPIGSSLSMAIVSLVTNNLNPGETMCMIASKPPQCEDNPDIECINTINSSLLKMVVVAAPLVFVFISNCIILTVIWWSVYSISRKSRSYLLALSKRMSVRSTLALSEPDNVNDDDHCNNNIDREDDDEDIPIERRRNVESSVNDRSRSMNEPRIHLYQCISCNYIKSQYTKFKQLQRRSTISTPASALAERLARPSRSTTDFLKSLFYRALAFGIGFSLTYGPSLIHRTLEISRDDGEVPFGLVFISRFLLPLQGLFNVIIYTFPFVITYHSQNQCSWFHAFCHVVKSGGDMDRTYNGLSVQSLRSSNAARQSVAFPVL